LHQVLRCEGDVPVLARGVKRIVEIVAVDMINDGLKALEDIRDILLEVLYKVVCGHPVCPSVDAWGRSRRSYTPVCRLEVV